MVVVFLISIGDRCNKHEQMLKFWLGGSYAENYLDLSLLFFSRGTESYDHQSIEVSNNGYKIDNCTF